MLNTVVSNLHRAKCYMFNVECPIYRSILSNHQLAASTAYNNHINICVIDVFNLHTRCSTFIQWNAYCMIGNLH